MELGELWGLCLYRRPRPTPLWVEGLPLRAQRAAPPQKGPSQPRDRLRTDLSHVDNRIHRTEATGHSAAPHLPLTHKLLPDPLPPQGTERHTHTQYGAQAHPMLASAFTPGPPAALDFPSFHHGPLSSNLLPFQGKGRQVLALPYP